MSALRSALDELASVDNQELSIGELDSDIQELLDAQGRIEVHLADKALADLGILYCRFHHILGHLNEAKRRRGKR